MSSFTFDFNDMIEWYRDNLDDDEYFTDDENVIGFILEEDSDKEVKKYHKDTGKLGRFLYKAEKIKNTVRKINFVTKSKHCPMGYYSVLLQNNTMFCVFPRLKSDENDNTHVFGDHVSFMYNKGVPKQIQLHITMYQPSPLDISIGTTPRYDSHFRDGITLSVDKYDTQFIDNKLLHPHYAKDILDFCRVYKSAQMKTKKRKRSNQATLDVSSCLTELLVQEHIKKITAFGFKHDGIWHMTTFMERHDTGHVNFERDIEDDENGMFIPGAVNYDSYWSFAFKTKTAGWGAFQKSLCDAIQLNKIDLKVI
jgi:hypothetical protein